MSCFALSSSVFPDLCMVVYDKQRETVLLFMLGKEDSLDLVFLAHVKFLLLSWVS